MYSTNMMQESAYERVIAFDVPGKRGSLKLVASNDALLGVYFGAHDMRRGASFTGRHAVLDAAEAQLREFILGSRRVFALPLSPRGTSFQRDVWEALRTIPFGETRSYADIARAIGRPSAVRAVGAANGKNPLSIIVPCHRVIGSDGSLTGYAGGMERKQWLLQHELACIGRGSAPAAFEAPIVPTPLPYRQRQKFCP